MTKGRAHANAANASNAANKRTSRPHEKTLDRASAQDPERETGPDSSDTFEETLEGPERPGVLTRSQIAAIRNLRSKSWSTDRIHEYTGLSKATVHKYTKDVVAQPGTEEIEDGLSPRPSAANIVALRKLRAADVEPEMIERITGFPIDIVVQHTSDVVPEKRPPGPTDTDTSQGPLVPRLHSEIVGAPRPRIVEENNNGHETSEPIHPSVVVESYNGGPTGPVRIVIAPDHPALQSLLTELLSLASSRDMSFDQYLKSQAIQDLRDCLFCKTLIVGDGEIFRENLLGQVKKANLHDRYRVDAGFDPRSVEH